jgi:trehalose-6-phosphate synthase
MKKKMGSCKVIVGIERLDYIKGIIQKLIAFEELFETNREMIGKVI